MCRLPTRPTTPSCPKHVSPACDHAFTTSGHLARHSHTHIPGLPLDLPLRALSSPPLNLLGARVYNHHLILPDSFQGPLAQASDRTPPRGRSSSLPQSFAAIFAIGSFFGTIFPPASAPGLQKSMVIALSI
ncbi:hypothetical protein BDN72DRAFT_907041 [Pluteus cervinus]|uniref:Uncharacterized protein n=1 Tax=Pluteus cervinus TaxID=181527 RepID=A0ACD2ZXN5_9AGAR|nr:hypothetical protein BDN72DRAFT_907041 [Pluteus cervinus]